MLGSASDCLAASRWWRRPNCLLRFVSRCPRHDHRRRGARGPVDTSANCDSSQERRGGTAFCGCAHPGRSSLRTHQDEPPPYMEAGATCTASPQRQEDLASCSANWRDAPPSWSWGDCSATLRCRSTSSSIVEALLRSQVRCMSDGATKDRAPLPQRRSELPGRRQRDLAPQHRP